MTSSLVVRTRSAEETRRGGRALGEAARPGDGLLLEGSFGVGKTVLVQGLAAGLGVAEEITSPSFVLMVEHHGRLPLYHVDLYRLDGRLDDELLENLADYQEAGGVCAIEWPEAMPDYDTDPDAYRRYQDATLKPFGQAVGRLRPPLTFTDLPRPTATRLVPYGADEPVWHQRAGVA